MKKLFLFIFILWGSVLTAEPTPVRVISLSPALTDAVVLIGGIEQLCGRSRVCNSPGTVHIPVAGDMGNPAVETIIRLKPDYVISDTFHPGGKWSQLKRAGIKIIDFPGTKIDDFPKNLRKLGKLLKLESSAEFHAARFEQQLRSLKAALPAARQSALAVFGVSPVISCSGKSFIHEALTLAGLSNICKNGKGVYFTVSAEYILRRDPDVIIVAGVPETAVKNYFSRPEFRHLTAIKKRRIIFVDPDRFCRAGSELIPEIILLRKKIQRIVSPGAAVLPSSEIVSAEMLSKVR